MATYAIGDVQGCFSALMRLLDKIHFDEVHDTLWFTGDLINRGPESYQALTFFRALPARHQIVLGNHDLHLLACAYGLRKPAESDTLDEILQADDKDDLMSWLIQRPMLVHDEKLNYVMSHAGLAPMWTLADASRLAREIEDVLRSDTPERLLAHMYGNMPDCWNESLSGSDRLRCIVNYFTRMRYCDAKGRLELSYKGSLADKPDDMIPWYLVESRKNADVNIIFGHWAALGGNANTPHVFALDTGCVWGGELTAMCLEDERRISVIAKEP